MTGKPMFRITVYAVAALVGMFLPLNEGMSATCSDSGHTDRSGKIPVVDDSGDPGLPLRCYVDSEDGHFRLYFNNCDDPSTGCVDEQIDEEYVAWMGVYLECAWQLFVSPHMSSTDLAFESPIDSPWMATLNTPENEDYVPAWIDNPLNSASASQEPRLHFPAHGRLYDVVTPNAIHEFAHLLGYGYSDYLIHRVPFVNEGLPTFFERVFRAPNSLRYSDTERCFDQDTFLDLSSSSIRTKKYCEAARFWHYLARFGGVDDPPEFYEHDEMAPSCGHYSFNLNKVMLPNRIPATPKYPTSGVMRRIPGRDIIKAFYDRAAQCFPSHKQTPFCSENLGFSASCSYPHPPLHGSQPACRPDNGYLRDLFARQLFRMSYQDAISDPDATATEIESRKNTIKDQRRTAIGVVMMPWIMDAVDYAALTTWPATAPVDPKSGDGIAHFMFRDFLEWNYKQPQRPLNMPVTNSVDSDTEGFRIHAYGAHYHQLDISNSPVWVSLRKGDDLFDWAYGAFYVADEPQGRVLYPVNNYTASSYALRSAWRNKDHDELYIPLHDRFDKAVIIVTAFDAEFDPSTVSQVGHYRLGTARWRIGTPRPPVFWRPWPRPMLYGPYPWLYRSTPFAPGLKPPPWIVGGGPWYYLKDSAIMRRQQVLEGGRDLNSME
jgi:hypothetical protein